MALEIPLSTAVITAYSQVCAVDVKGREEVFHALMHHKFSRLSRQQLGLCVQGHQQQEQQSSSIKLHEVEENLSILNFWVTSHI